MHILIVEDDDDGRDNFVDVLELDDHKVTAACSGKEALDFCETLEFDSIILDWNLLDATADRLIPHIKKLQPQKPIIVVTGYGDVELVVSAMRTGVWDYLAKPINPEVLRATLARVEERKANLESIDRIQQKLVASERLAAIGQMVAGLAHESRNAFQRSQACLEMLELNLEEDEENLAIVAKIQTALEQLHQLYEEVRDYAAPIVLEKTQVNVCAMIQDTWQEISIANPQSTSELTIECTDEIRIKNYSLDMRRIQQVFRNVLENARDANEKNLGKRSTTTTETPSIIVKIFEQENELCISISDTGGGIESSNKTEIFEPFVTTKTRGTGLGLAICRRIVDSHLGKIEAADCENGSVFEIRIPIR